MTLFGRWPSRPKYAGQDIELAAEYLQHAADSAHYPLGPDTREIVTQLYSRGRLTGEVTEYDHNTLGMRLQAIEKGLARAIGLGSQAPAGPALG